MSENVSQSTSLSSRLLNKNDDGVVSIRRYVGKPWEKLFDVLPQPEKEEKGKSETFVHRLLCRDMGLYGLFPEKDRFTAVVCDCGVVVKPQGLKNHLAKNHSGSLKNSGYFGTAGNNGSSYARSSSSNSPASSTSSTPVKNSEDFSVILPTITRHHKSISSKLKTKVSKTGTIIPNKSTAANNSAANLHSSESMPMPSAGDMKTGSTMPDFVINATSTSLDSSSYTFSNSKVQNLSPVSSSKRNKKSHRSKDVNLDRYCGVFVIEEGRPCHNLLAACKNHSIQMRRQLAGRSKLFDILYAEQRGPVDQIPEVEPSLSSSSSLLEKPITNAELKTEILKVEMPTIVLRKIDENIVKGISEQTMQKMLQTGSILIQSHEEDDNELNETIISEIPPDDLIQILNQQSNDDQPIEHPEDVFKNHQNNPDMDEPKLELYTSDQPPTENQIIMRTVAFPLQALFLHKNVLNDPFTAQTMIAEDARKENQTSMISNIISLQSCLPPVIDSYCDVYSKYEQSLLGDGNSLFQTLHPVDNHEHSNEKIMSRYDSQDLRSIKPCLYSQLPKPSCINTYGMRRIGGGATISRRSYYLRRTLLKTKDGDKKLKIKTDVTGYTNTSSSQHQSVLLTSPSSVNKARKRSFLANPINAKVEQIANEICETMGDTSSELNKFDTEGYSHRFNQNRLELESSLDELLQPKRQLFVPRY